MAIPENTPKEEALQFGAFRLFPSRRLLLEAGRPVRIGNRALDILIVLAEHAGSLVTKEELIAYAWPNTIVDHISLRVHIAALRRSLGDGDGGNRYIVNVVGRGYSFVGSVTRDSELVGAIEPPLVAPYRSQLPALLTRMIGRAAAVDVLKATVPQRRFVTIVGVGGVGKSTLALEVASQLIDSYENGACFVELGSTSDSFLVPTALATVIGMTISNDDPLPGLLSFLKDKRMLLVLDNCEHVISAAAQLAESVLKGAPSIHILATSREPLSAEGEYQYRLAPLDLPQPSESVTAAVACGFSAVQLFVERAKIAAQAFEIADSNALSVCEICRRLDGIPLAIELAAARVSVLGVYDLAARLDDHFLFEVTARRTAGRRHHTLRAALDWSYELLAASEQCVLQRLSVFKSAFTLDSAMTIAARRGISRQEVLDGVISLVDKSLITVDVTGTIALHRLLNTTRTYAFEKLSDTRDIADIFRWHAECVYDLLQRAEVDWVGMSRAKWVDTYGYAIDDVRAAIDWELSPNGDTAKGAALTVAAIPFGFQLALFDEFRDRAEYALKCLEALAIPQPITQSRLNAALHGLHMNQKRIASDNSGIASRNHESSEIIGVVKYQVQPLIHDVVAAIELGNYRDAVDVAERLYAVATNTGDPLALVIADRVMAQAQHFVGHHAMARALADKALKHPARSLPLVYSAAPVDRRVSMRILLARILWIEGSPDQATQLADECLEYASSDSPLALCQALALAACPIAHWCGNIEKAEQLSRRLLEESTRFRLSHWYLFGKCYEQVARLGNIDLSRRAPDHSGMLDIEPSERLLSDTLITIAPDVIGTANARQIVDETIGWCAPELLRAGGEIALKQNDSNAMYRAETMFQKSLNIACTQNALAWTLRTSMSLARLWSQQNRAEEACALLSSVYARFSEGYGTRDLVNANALIENLRSRRYEKENKWLSSEPPKTRQ